MEDNYYENFTSMLWYPVQEGFALRLLNISMKMVMKDIAYSDGIKSRGYKIGNKLDRKYHGLLSRISGKQGYFSLFKHMVY